MPRVALFALALACAASAHLVRVPPPPPDPLVAATTDALATHRAGDEGSALEKYERIPTNAADAAPLPAAAAQLHTNAGAIRYGRGDAARASALRARGRARPDAIADAVLNLALVLSEDVGAQRARSRRWP